ncbi:MAG: nucleotidyltransferase domain-containing protein [Actinobacteria bacterium]|nr:nucleotidyltransferase domain-containing protein [Actinomycetota bacterium]
MSAIDRIDSEQLTAICENYGVACLEVFGSTSRGDDGDDSDVDLLYTLRPATRLGWLIDDLERELSGIFGRPVDLVAKSALHPKLRDRVLAEARPLYAA